MVIFYKVLKKYNEIQLIKKIDFINRKIKNRPTFPVITIIIRARPHLLTSDEGQKQY